MKTLYLDCGMGAAGDMLTAALLELLPDKEQFLEELNGLGIPGVEFVMEVSEKCGIRGTHVSVKINGEEESEEIHDHDHDHDHDHEAEHEHEDHDHEHHEHVHIHDHEHEHIHVKARANDHFHVHVHVHEPGHHHHHSGMHEIEHIVEDMQVSDKVKSDVMAVYGLIAEAESSVHGVPVTEIHFHEVGTLDAVADVTAVCLLMERLAPDQVIASPVHVGSGQVKCAHGILPVPAPATAYILKDVPIYGGAVRGELCTPTGAALLKHFVTKFGDMPLMKVDAVGYGMGKKDFNWANCVRALLGETEDPRETVVELCCNLDDMTAEAVGFAEEQFLAAGALDVYVISAQMKKNRPGYLLTVMCREADKEEMLRLMFLHTTTLGIRENVSIRYALTRSVGTVETEFGPVRLKKSAGYGVTRCKYEYEDLARIARDQGMSLDEVKHKLNQNI